MARIVSTRPAGAGASIARSYTEVTCCGDTRPREVRRPRPAPRHPFLPACWVDRERAKGLGKLERHAGGTSSPSRPWVTTWPVAGDVGRDDRSAGRERLGQDHAEALAAQRRGAQHVGLVQAAPELLVVHAAVRLDAVHAALDLGEQRLDALGGPHRSPRGGRNVPAQTREGGQQHGQALALLLAADEHDLQGVVDRLRPARRRVEVDPFGITSYVPPKYRSPVQRRGLGDSDPRVSLLSTRRAPIARAIAFGSQLGRIGVEGADHRRAASKRAGVPADQGAIGSCTWMTSKSPPRSSLRSRTTVFGVTDSRDIAPFIGSATVRPSGIT